MEGNEVGRGRDSGVVSDRESANRTLNIQTRLCNYRRDISTRNMLLPALHFEYPSYRTDFSTDQRIT